jgi:hypothetical protein
MNVQGRKSMGVLVASRGAWKGKIQCNWKKVPLEKIYHMFFREKLI